MKSSKVLDHFVGPWFLLLAAAVPAPAMAQAITRVSVDSSGVQGNSISYFPSISADGRYVAFESEASNLVSGDTNDREDVFVHDRQSGVTTRVSVHTSGAEGDQISWKPSISGDGTLVAFSSYASTLVTNDTNFAPDIFVHDLQSGQTTCVSVDSSGVQGNNHSHRPTISADGRFVAFYSGATNLVPGDANAAWDVFIHDRQTGQTTLVSVSSAGVQGDFNSGVGEMIPRIGLSSDGRFVAFQSAATNLVSGDTNGKLDIFVRDRQTSQTTRVSLGSSGSQGNDDSLEPAMSSDGRYVTFTSWSTNLMTGDTNGFADIFLRDRQTGQTTRVSLDSSGVQGNSWSEISALSADGRYVAFQSFATNLVPGDTAGQQDSFVHDRLGGLTSRVSVAYSGAETNHISLFPVISSDGLYVAFHSLANNLVPGDSNLSPDIFVNDLDAWGRGSLCDPGMAGLVSCPCSNAPSGLLRGCNNYGSTTGGAALTGAGFSSLSSDTVKLSVFRENATALTVFWTGDSDISPPGVAHGAGVRCIGGQLRRLYTGSAVGGAATRPAGGGPTVSARSAAVGVPINSGDTRYYFTIYRDPSAAGPCGNTATTINLSNVLSVAWTP